jgi:hypothetical protein
MTLFEYLAVSVSVVLSFGAVRLLDALPHTLSRDKRYWVHTIWVVNVLWFHAQFWWVFWSYNSDVLWSYPKFLLALTQPGLLYSLAVTLVSTNASTITSWHNHFYRVRTRFCVLFALWFSAITLSMWFLLHVPIFHFVRAIQGGFLVLFVVGAFFPRPWYHALLSLLCTALLIFLTSVGFFHPAPLFPMP